MVIDDARGIIELDHLMEAQWVHNEGTLVELPERSLNYTSVFQFSIKGHLSIRMNMVRAVTPHNAFDFSNQHRIWLSKYCQLPS